MIRLILAVVSSVFILGCASQQAAQRAPILYPSESMARKSQAQVSRDIQECDQRAQDMIPEISQSTKTKRVLLAALESAVVGTAVGAVGGSIVSNAGRGAGAGAAIGGMTGAYGAIKELNNVDPHQRGFIKACLEEKGYKVIGWESDLE